MAFLHLTLYNIGLSPHRTPTKALPITKRPTPGPLAFSTAPAKSAAVHSDEVKLTAGEWLQSIWGTFPHQQYAQGGLTPT